MVAGAGRQSGALAPARARALPRRLAALVLLHWLWPPSRPAVPRACAAAAGSARLPGRDEPWVLPDGEPYVKILHPAQGQTVAAEWQGMLIASVGNFEVPAHGSVAVYLDDALAARLAEWPQTLMLPQLPDGAHSIAVSLQDSSLEVVAEDVVEIVYANASAGPPLWDVGLEEGAGAGGRLSARSGGADADADANAAGLPGGRGGEELTVIWTCPDWEVDWISELLGDAGVRFRIVYDASLQTLAPNALVALSQNDERNRPPELLARYLRRFRQQGFRVGVLHMSDEDYTAPTYFYPWVHYVLRNHYQESLARLPHVLAVPLGYKKGFWTAGDAAAARATAAAAGDGNGGRGRQYLWNFVGQTHDKPTRKSMLAAAERLDGQGFVKLTNYWNDSTGLATHEFRDLLLDARITLCPRGFVHPESFRLVACIYCLYVCEHSVRIIFMQLFMFTLLYVIVHPESFRLAAGIRVSSVFLFAV